MHQGVAFILYLAVGSILIFTFLLICVRVSVFIEDTCPARFCLKRKQRKVRKTLIRRMLYPDEEPESPRPAPPSDENITSDIICQPYIYRDAYSTGLTGLSMLANLPLSIGYINEGNPGDAVVTNAEQLRQNGRLLSLRAIRNQYHQRISNASENIPPSVSDEISLNQDAEVASLPPDYSNATTDSIKVSIEDEPPPPSYYECVLEPRENSQGGGNEFN